MVQRKRIKDIVQFVQFHLENGLVKLITFRNMTIEESLEKFVALFNIKFMLFQFMETTHHVLFHNQLPFNGKKS